MAGTLPAHQAGGQPMQLRVNQLDELALRLRLAGADLIQESGHFGLETSCHEIFLPARKKLKGFGVDFRISWQSPQVFLRNREFSDFPTARRSVCAPEGTARSGYGSPLLLRR